MMIRMDEAITRLHLYLTDGQYIVIDRTGDNSISIWATNNLGIELVASNLMRVNLLETEKVAAGPATAEEKGVVL